MATLNWTGNAAATKQIDTITVADVWATSDTVTLTMNGKDLVVTIGTQTTTAQVATAIMSAWNATSRLDSEGVSDATSNFGGQEFGEFSEAQAHIDDDATSVVIITARTAGVPFTLSVAETTAGSGTATEATAQAATGPHHWNNGDNWTGGSAPASDDVVVFKDNDVSVLYGLPNGSLEVTIQQWQSYTGSIGLPATNRSNAQKPYTEYRQRYVRLDDAGGGSNIAHRFGLGQSGNGSPLINLKHSTVKCSPIVYNTGTPQISGTKALNICCTANTSTLNIIGTNSSVDWGSQDSGTAAFLTVTQAAGDSIGVAGLHTTDAVCTMTGGTMTVGGSGAIATFIVRGGTLRLENQTGNVTTIEIHNTGVVFYASTATIANLLIFAGGTFDARGDSGGFTATGVTWYPTAKFIDPYRRLTIGSAFSLYGDPSPDLQFGTSTADPISVDNAP